MRLSAVALVAPSALILFATFPRTDAHASGEGVDFGLRLEAGAEFDSNPTRREVIAGQPSEEVEVPSPAGRVALSADLAKRLGTRLQLSLAGGIAGRRMLRLEARGEDLAVSEGQGAFSYLSERWSATALGSVYDVDQRAYDIAQARDFRSLSAAARGAAQIGQGRLHAGVGWRWFTFKPEAAFDFHGPIGSLGYRHTPRFTLDGRAEWEYGAQASLESRQFAPLPCTDMNCTSPATKRRDRFFTIDADVTRTGDQLLGAGVALQRNDSVRFGETLTRLLAHVRLVALLPGELSLAARAELVATRYADPVPVGQVAQTNAFITIEDEGRSSLRLDLSRVLLGRLEGGLRYTFYTQTPGSGPVRFIRHLGFAYLALSVGR